MRLRFRPGSPIVISTFLQGPSGSVDARLLLDTGAVTTLIGPKVLERAGIDAPFSGGQVAITTASGIVQAPKVAVPTLDALGVSREDFVVTVHALPPSAPVDGLLGLDFLVGLHLTLDLREGELIVEA